jgi:hypothetical protein
MADSVPITRPADLLEAALSYAARAWRVIPLHNITESGCSCKRPECESQGKHPRVKDWPKDATTDTEKIRGWWKMWPLANVGIATGLASGLCVIDVDVARGGDDSLWVLQEELGKFPRTVESLTGGGGRHLLFDPRGAVVGCSSDKLGPGVDVRGDGGLIVAPPSGHISGKCYIWEASSAPGLIELAPLPAGLVALLRQVPGTRVRSSDELLIPEGRRNSTLAALAGVMRRRAFSAPAIYLALSEENKTRCKPPLDEVEVRNIARSYGRYQPGDPILGEPKSASGPQIWKPDDLIAADLPEPESFLSTVLTRGEVALIAGRRGVGKTYLTLFMAQQIALGKPFGHMVTRPGRVLYLSQEMSEVAIRKRIRKLFRPEALEEISKRLRILCKHQVRLDSDEGAEALAKLIGADRFDIAFIDALRDVKGGLKENSNDEMGTLMVRLRDAVAGPCNVCIVVLHHKGKPGEHDTDRGGRGASALEDVPVDVIYLGRKGKNKRRTISFEKTREDFEGAELWYEIAGGQEPDSTEIIIGAGEPIEERRAADAARDTLHQKTIEKLASEVERQIRKHGPLSGRQLADLTGGRGENVREATRGLEAQGVLESSPGPHGAFIWALTTR